MASGAYEKARLRCLYNNTLENTNMFWVQYPVMSSILYCISVLVPITVICSCWFLCTDISVWTHLIYLFGTYITENMTFMLFHMLLHATFVEVHPDEIKTKMTIFHKVAYLHHYYNPMILSLVDFRTYILSYFTGSFECISSPSAKWLSMHRVIALIGGLLSMYYAEFHMNILLVYTGYCLNLVRLYKHVLFIIVYLFTKDILGTRGAVLYGCYGLLMVYIQALVHRWYHTPPSKRCIHFGSMLYTGMMMLEWIHLISTQYHTYHHKHSIVTMHEVEVWNDMWMPVIFTSTVDKLWQSAQAVYVHGEHRMTEYIHAYIRYRIVIASVLLPFCIGLCKHCILLLGSAYLNYTLMPASP
jgi:hypothetical protein